MPTMLACAWVGLVAGAGIAAEDRGSTRSPRNPASTLGSLPATYTGLLPCADCVGTRYQINLLPGHAYMQRTTYLRAGSDHSSYELGAWSLSNDGRTLTLDGGRKSPTRWDVQNRETLRKLDLAGNPTDSGLRYELTRSASVEPMQPRVRLVGMFRYLADAARFRDCQSGLAWPVEMSSDYRALERAYGARRSEPGAELMVSIDGRIEPRPKMEGTGTEPTLVVEKFVAARPGESCEESASQSGLENSRWRPVRIGDQSVTVAGQQREPWIVLDPRTKRVTGSGGCNRISGSYDADRDSLRFAPILSTMMACPAMATESAFLHALNDTRRYRVRGRVLELLDARGRLLARLEERNLR